MARRRRLRAGALLVAAAAAVASCGGSAGSDAGPPGDEGEIVVLAAASLTGAFGDLADAFAAAEAGRAVRLELGSSSALATQIEHGAPADVFASADDETMARLVDAVGTAGPPRAFATNGLEIVVAVGNPLGIDGLADLARPDVVFVGAAPQVPIGRYSQQALDRAGVVAEPRSLEGSVKGVLTKVVLGEADAGIVYRTDVLAAGDAVEGVDVDPTAQVQARYLMAVPTGAGDPAAGTAFVDFVLSPAGQSLLRAHGFGAP